MDAIEQLKYNFKNGNVTIKLIFICVAVFVVDIILGLFKVNLSSFLSVAGGFEGFLRQPWGILTYSFFHGNVFHLALNMLMLYVIGNLFLRYFRNNDLLTFYFWGSIFGALFFIIFSEFYEKSVVLLGASAAVYSVFFALVAYVPKMKLQLAIINVTLPLDYLAYGLLAFDVLMIIADSNAGGHVSHLGGAAFGFLYMKQFEKGRDFLGSFWVKLFTPKPKVQKRTHRPTPPRDDYEFNSQKVAKQKKIDAILDKISSSGYESLSKEEKDFLFKSGKNG